MEAGTCPPRGSAGPPLEQQPWPGCCQVASWLGAAQALVGSRAQGRSRYSQGKVVSSCRPAGPGQCRWKSPRRRGRPRRSPRSPGHQAHPAQGRPVEGPRCPQHSVEQHPPAPGLLAQLGGLPGGELPGEPPARSLSSLETWPGAVSHGNVAVGAPGPCAQHSGTATSTSSSLVAGQHCPSSRAARGSSPAGAYASSPSLGCWGESTPGPETWTPTVAASFSCHHGARRRSCRGSPSVTGSFCGLGPKSLSCGPCP